MKKNYIEIKKWILENGMELQQGDTIKIKFNLTEKQVGRQFLDKHPDNEVVFCISRLTKSFIEGTVDGKKTSYLLLYPRDIIDIEPYLDKTQDELSNDLEEEDKEI